MEVIIQTSTIEPDMIGKHFKDSLIALEEFIKILHCHKESQKF